MDQKSKMIIFICFVIILIIFIGSVAEQGARNVKEALDKSEYIESFEKGSYYKN